MLCKQNKYCILSRKINISPNVLSFPGPDLPILCLRFGIIISIHEHDKMRCIRLIVVAKTVKRVACNLVKNKRMRQFFLSRSETLARELALRPQLTPVRRIRF